MGDNPIITPDGGTDAGGQDATLPDAKADANNGDAGVVDAATDADADTGSSYSPAQLSGLVLWLDAQDTASLQTTGTTVNQWNDRSSHQNPAISYAGHEPSTSTYVATSKPVVAFNHSAMQVVDKTELHWGATTDVLVEFVAAYTSPAGGTFFNKLGAVFADAGNNRFGLIAANPTVDATQVWMSLDHGGQFGVADTASTQDGKMRLYAVRRTSNGLTLSIRTNGVQSVTRNLSSVVNIDSAGYPIVIGATDGVPDEAITAVFGEIIIVSGTITDPELVALESYLQTKWQL